MLGWICAFMCLILAAETKSDILVAAAGLFAIAGALAWHLDNIRYAIKEMKSK